MQSFFPSNTYDTPEATPHRVLDTLFLRTRIYFAGAILREIDRSRRQALAGRYDDEAWAKSSHNIFKIIEGVGGRFHLSGIDNIRNACGPVVFISNHMSALETMVFPCIIAPLKQVTFVVKESLVKGNFFGPVMRSRDPIAVGRASPKEDLQEVMTKGQELLAKGVSIIIFPQNTRQVEFVPEEFNSLGVKLAKKAGVQVIPVAIKTDFWGNGTLIKDFGPLNRQEPIYMAFGEPISISGTGKEEHRRVTEYISTHLKKRRNFL
jgi:1-acyl-sn-glycerol-3-phosphate acyltransferase